MNPTRSGSTPTSCSLSLSSASDKARPSESTICSRGFGGLSLSACRSDSALFLRPFSDRCWSSSFPSRASSFLRSRFTNERGFLSAAWRCLSFVAMRLGRFALRRASISSRLSRPRDSAICSRVVAISDSAFLTSPCVFLCCFFSALYAARASTCSFGLPKPVSRCARAGVVRRAFSACSAVRSPALTNSSSRPLSAATCSSAAAKMTSGSPFLRTARSRLTISALIFSFTCASARRSFGSEESSAIFRSRWAPRSTFAMKLSRSEPNERASRMMFCTASETPS